MVDWMPTNPILRVLTPSLRDLVSYPVKVEDDSIYINVQGKGDLAEIVFGGASTGQAGKTATNIDVDEVRVQFIPLLILYLACSSMCPKVIKVTLAI
jgi:hypothetical protein